MCRSPGFSSTSSLSAFGVSSGFHFSYVNLGLQGIKHSQKVFVKLFCICLCVDMHHGKYLVVRRQPVGAGSLLPPYGLPGTKTHTVRLGGRHWLSPSESSFWPTEGILNDNSNFYTMVCVLFRVSIPGTKHHDQSNLRRKGLFTHSSM